MTETPPALTPPFLLFDRGPQDQPSFFGGALKTIIAETPTELPGAFERLQAAHEAGYWLAGAASYELGYALSPRLAPLMPTERALPLLEFGVFHGPTPEPVLSGGTFQLGPFTPSWTFERYRSAFETVMGYIVSGDIYQANLTFSMQAAFQGDASALYAALRAAQPVPHGVWASLERQQVLSRSPELFFRISDSVIETRPMKGTQPRCTDPVEDASARERLAVDEKNCAENLMIVDLLRNDLSRICRPGTVRVPELFAVESYATVHQMVSLIRGDLAGRPHIATIFEALFPCGSVTGAPKIRAMEILRELETGPREAYCGSLGWIAPSGDMSFNVAIRSLMLQGGVSRLNVGGGVVYDSTAEAEYEEALWKARFATHSLKGSS